MRVRGEKKARRISLGRGWFHELQNHHDRDMQDVVHDIGVAFDNSGYDIDVEFRRMMGMEFVLNVVEDVIGNY